MPDLPPEPIQLTAEEKAEESARFKARRRQEQWAAEKRRWMIEGWGGVGVEHCEHCQEWFSGAAYVYDDFFDDRVYLCAKCYRRWAEPPYVKPAPCEVCGRVFGWFGGQVQLRPHGVGPRPRPRTHICSVQCRRERRNRTRRVLPSDEKRRCAGCRKTFIPTRADQLYHSAACRQRAYRARHS